MGVGPARSTATWRSDLWASVDAIVEAGSLPDLGRAQVDYDDDPFGVQYWVMRWCEGVRGCQS